MMMTTRPPVLQVRDAEEAARLHARDATTLRGQLAQQSGRIEHLEHASAVRAVYVDKLHAQLEHKAFAVSPFRFVLRSVSVRG